MRLFLGKNQRLKSERDIKTLFETGRTVFVYPIKMVYNEKMNSNQGTRILVSVSKKNFKKAVVRNILKRRLREAYRLNQELLPTYRFELHIAFIYVSNEVLLYKQIEEVVKTLLIQLKSKFDSTRAQISNEN